MCRCLLLAVLVTYASAQVTPTIRNITNAASYTDPLLPNSTIAQGSMFLIKGDNLGPTQFDVADIFPLTTVRSGTSVKIVNVGRQGEYDAIIYYASQNQVAAIMPSNVFEGQALIRLIYNDVSSGEFPVTVSKTQLGIFTINQSGGGEAVATRSDDYSRLSPGNPAHPGDVIILWGTGLGPIAGDEKQAAPQFDMTSIPVQAWIGGKSADVVFRGRNACCTSVDTIYVRVPPGVSGCATPVTVKAGDSYSNTTLIPAALTGNICTPTLPILTTSDLSQLVNKDQVWYGHLTLDRFSQYPDAIVEPIGATEDQGFGDFTRYDVSPGWLGYTSWDMVAPRTCVVTTNAGFIGPLRLPQITTNGPIMIAGPGSPQFGQIVQNPVTGVYYGVLGASGYFVAPGTFSILTRDFHNASASVTLNYSTPLTWTNSAQLSTINRGAGAIINWTGGDPNGFVEIKAIGSLTGRAGGISQVSVTATCIAPTNDHTFTIPSYVLAALPATQPGNPAVLFVSGVHSIKKMEGGGFDISSAFIYDHAGIDVTYR